jgi:predicted P-loop ATPase/GTPase
MNPHDSGKTTFAIQLMQVIHQNDNEVEYFKPLSGHNYWYHYSHTKKCLESEQLVSYDAERVRQNHPSDIPILIANPVHTLYAPARTERPSQSNILTTLGLAGWDSILVAKRFSQPIENGIQSIMLVAQSLLANNSLIMSQKEIERLSSNAETIPVSSLEDIQAFENQVLESMISASFSYLEDTSDVIVIESFNNSAWPWERLEYVDRVFAVGPGHLFQYEPGRFQKAAFMLQRPSLPIREVTLNRIDELLKPISRYQLSPSNGLPKDFEKLMKD